MRCCLFWLYFQSYECKSEIQNRGSESTFGKEVGFVTHALHVMVAKLESTSNGPGAVAWVLSVLAVLAIAVSYWLMRQDALNGGHQAWPADAFAGSAFFAAVVFGYIGAKLTRR